jgi:hypothetical protein
MDLRQQLLLAQRFMHLWKDLLIGNGGMGCLDMGDQVRTLLITRFSEMDFISNPVHASLGA